MRTIVVAVGMMWSTAALALPPPGQTERAGDRTLVTVIPPSGGELEARRARVGSEELYAAFGEIGTDRPVTSA